MRTINRNSVHIEQCERCHGVFLDGGELEQILAAEREHYANVPPPAPIPMPLPHESGELPVPPAGSPPPAYAGPAEAQPAGAPPPYQPPPGTPPPGYATPQPGYAQPVPGYGYNQGYYHQPRRRSFLEELLD
jgi:Zn-finger nucleic acid-binding protein